VSWTSQGQRRNFQQGKNNQAPSQAVQLNLELKKNDLEGAILQFLTAQQQTIAQTSQTIAYAVCESETRETWTWFLSTLFDDIGSSATHRWALMSYRQKIPN
jgi:hypothetical protein